MRRISILVLFLALGAFSQAQSGYTVQDFDRFLAGIEQKSDSEAAGWIAGHTLNERAKSSDLARWKAELKGEKARRALTAVFDASEFQKPPASEIVDEPAPTAAAQIEILDRTATYIKETLPRLPNFLAIRTTARFNVTTRQQLDEQQRVSELYQLTNWKPKVVQLGAMNGQILFFVGEWQFVVTYRDHSEVSEAQVGNNRHRPPLGLDTTGEFGPILTTVFGDARQGTISFNRWESGPGGKLAVFNYDVPKAKSNYLILNAETEKSETPAYYGELAIEPSTGTIERITLKAESTVSSVEQQSNMFLEYGPVEIGGETYTCPLHGVVYSQPKMVDASGNPAPGAEKEKSAPVYLNDVTFSDYHLFRSQVRILSDNPEH
ncbi:MAG TPA: hypothetical protein VL986_03465 [Terracidiphilus sp.]|nr:hypothetical protein [Terracidiphilus sp.]